MTGQSSDQVAAFSELERAAWCADSVAESYTTGWENLTTQSIPSLLQATRVVAGSKVLDVATGPGFAARAAAEAGASMVVGLDFSEAFLSRCREYCRDFQTVSTVCGDAQSFPTSVVEAGPFDAVLCNFGVLHLAQPEKLLENAWAVLTPGGRLAMTCWALPPATAVFDVVLRAVKEHGNPNVSIPEGPPFFQFADPLVAVSKLHAAGFSECSLVQVPQELVVDNAQQVWEMLYQGTARTRALLQAQEVAALEAIRSAIEIELTTKYSTPEGKLNIPMPSAMATGIGRSADDVHEQKAKANIPKWTSASEFADVAHDLQQID
eukprot:CAMPEP_0114235530 /NCGR_PEP_ID=MMETSP0058-20121206/6300_1 /TAXON_ID=36894 /ORGANISM="Pyramimonas parkeae, CCMP726" /LENGTH=321 /DNA_ID=CAMNT_0001347299 /DNA_START=193 /DNA_END=1159 /DNA_ORIENTATION=-